MRAITWRFPTSPTSRSCIRDYRRLPPAADDDDAPDRAAWWEETWTPTPTGQLDAPRLIPMVMTGAMDRPQTLVDWYRGRWPAQENHVKLWLLPLGLDVNAGFQKTAVANRTMNAKLCAICMLMA